MAMTEEIFDELYEEDPNSFLMIADVTNFDDDSLGDVVWYYLGGKDYASVCKLSKHRCCSCGTPIRRRGVRRVVLCPICNAGNELK